MMAVIIPFISLPKRKRKIYLAETFSFPQDGDNVGEAESIFKTLKNFKLF